MKISISPGIKAACPEISLAILLCEVQNSPTCELLRNEMENERKKIYTSFKIDEIKNRSAIFATRKIYKTLGKDPNRYRPSAEALCRRIVREIPVYEVSTIVDIINIVSIRSGFSIGGFDADKIQGEIELGVGSKDDEYEAIGRGLMNVEGLPLFRDNIVGIGTPTSDNERTKISDNTTKLLIIINSYEGIKGLQDASNHTTDLLSQYAKLKNIKTKIVNCNDFL